MDGSENGAPPPGAMLGAMMMQRDPRAEPNYGERVPYVLAANGGRLQNDRAMTVEDFMRDPGNRLWAEHYIQMMRKALARAFNLAGVNVDTWSADVRAFKSVGRPLRAAAESSQAAVADVAVAGKLRITDHFASNRCLACGARDTPNAHRVCDACLAAPAETQYALSNARRVATERQLAVHRICKTCTASTTARPHEAVDCDSIDCPVFFSRRRADFEARLARGAERVTRAVFSRAIKYERD